ncbi:MAG: hypothetical protein MZV64_35940 [Ignavibacteriales bacterium]|nr:hypothetical protein [Ignavibacteriales bacterium]
MEKLSLLGAEAYRSRAQSMLECLAYMLIRDTPSTEITEYVQNNKIAIERNIHSQWSANEKTAMEAGTRNELCRQSAQWFV